jgi:hypothetical protein
MNRSRNFLAEDLVVIVVDAIVVVPIISDILELSIGEDVSEHFDTIKKLVRTSFHSLSVGSRRSGDSGEHEANEEIHLGYEV